MKTVTHLLLLFLLIVSGISFGEEITAQHDEFSKAPTCTENGYISHIDQGTTIIEEIPALGHTFGEWILSADGMYNTRICQVCGYLENIHINTIPENHLPRLDLYGNMEGIGKKSKVVLEASFTSLDQSFHCYGILTLQGHSTYGMPKKNYTIRFYDDQRGNVKHKVYFRNWSKEHKYILKANYTDLTQCRNLVGANLWTEMVQSRNNVSNRIRELPTYGAVDGFPIAVYLNDGFFGLYTLNLHKDDDLYHMRSGKPEAILICNKQTEPESLFRSPATFTTDHSSDWEIEYCGTEDETWAAESFNELVFFVMNSNDQEFREHLCEHLDVDAAIDYLIFLYTLGLQNGGAKDLVMISFGDLWIPSAYDMDDGFGLDSANEAYLSPAEFLPQKVNGTWDSGTGSLLWDRLLENYTDTITDRYWVLRKEILTEESLLNRVQSFVSQIPESFFDYDYYLYPQRPVQDLYMLDQIKQYIHNRIPILDHVFRRKQE